MAALNVTKKLVEAHLVEGSAVAGEEVALRIDQTLTQDATGTLVMLELEAMGIERVRTEVSVQYVDHNLVQADHKNADDHIFLRSACRRFGLRYSRAGNGVSHAVHQERFGKPGKTLLGSDSHTPAAGALGMLAFGAGGIEVAMAAAGRPFFVRMPQVWGVRLTAALRPWVSAKDVILELLRRYGVKGAVGCVLEYHGPGLESLSAMDRHVLANMGTELGATSSVFPSDMRVCEYLRAQGREEDWSELVADADASYERYEEVDLSTIEPMIALPSSPDNVRRVSEVAGEKIYQAYIGSSANPGYRDLAVAAAMVDGRQVHPEVSFDVNPASRQVLATLIRDGALGRLVAAGARVHQAGCNGCIGMGQAPATDRISLRTVPRNFPGRSGTREDKVCLVSPETAAAGALTGVITDPRTLNLEYPSVTEPDDPVRIPGLIEEPPPPEEAREVPLVRGPNIVALPPLEPFPDEIEVAVLLKLADNVSTDEILPGGSRVLPWRSNIPAISRFTFIDIDATYATRATEVRDRGGHAIVAGENYGQGSSREHAAFAPRFLGLRVVLARSFARIHWQNLTSYGVLPLTLERGEDYDRLEPGGRLSLRRLHRQLRGGSTVRVERADGSGSFETTHHLSPRQLDVLLAGGLINWMRLVGRHEPLPSATR